MKCEPKALQNLERICQEADVHLQLDASKRVILCDATAFVLNSKKSRKEAGT